MTQQIVLKQFYSGRKTSEAVIPPGTYPVGDPLLFGLETYLVEELGMAYFIGEPEVSVPTPSPAPTPPQSQAESTPPADAPLTPVETQDYKAMSFEVLRALVAKRGVKVEPTGKNGAAKRTDLEEALSADDEKKAAEAANNGDTPQA